MELKMDHSYSTNSRDKYLSKDHSYFRFARKGTTVVHPRLYDPDPDSGRKDHSYFKLKPLETIVGRADAGPDHTYGNMRRPQERKPLRDANVDTSPLIVEEACVHIKQEVDDGVIPDQEHIDPAELEKLTKKQIVKDHTYVYSDRKASKKGRLLSPEKKDAQAEPGASTTSTSS